MVSLGLSLFLPGFSTREQAVRLTTILGKRGRIHLEKCIRPLFLLNVEKVPALSISSPISSWIVILVETNYLGRINNIKHQVQICPQ